MSSSDSIIKETSTLQPTFLGYKIIELSRQGISGASKIAAHIHKELPIRISHRIVELQNLPYNLSNMNSIVKLTDMYKESFYNFKHLGFPDNDDNENKLSLAILNHFNKLKEAIYLVSNGLNECILFNNQQQNVIRSCPFLNQFLDNFHGQRINTRFLTGHYIDLKKQLNNGTYNNETTKLGLIDLKLNVQNVLENAINDAGLLCEQNYGISPDVKIENKQNVEMTYVSSHLYYIFFEIIKNSMRAVCETHKNNMDNLPKINVVIVGNDDSKQVTIKISDQGGGISSNNMKKIWYYAFTTVKRNVSDSFDDIRDAPMAGFGYGLPLARLYARSLKHGLPGFSGGDLEIVSMDGYGTDAFIYLDWIKLT